MIWYLLDQLLREWVIQTQVSLCYFPPLQRKASATRLSTILETFFFWFWSNIQKISKKKFVKQCLLEYTNKCLFIHQHFWTSCLHSW